MRTTATVFLALFLAELGDKTQLAVVSFTAGGASRWAVFIGASLALIASTALAVLVGEGLLRVIRPAYLQLGAAAIFVVVGILVGVEALRALRG
ncbi:MAG TPA: TMEM165/GDT1 family protein [Egibacteraceae bacterium]|nr:TMEM165/GDT1 family protein [Egibacteraceae bacterium]